MKKELLICICLIFLLLCVFPPISFGNEKTEVKLSVHEIEVNCEENGYFIIEGSSYTNTHSFYIGDSGDVTINIIPNSGYKVDSINCGFACNSVYDDGKLKLTNVYDDVVVDIKFKEILTNEKQNESESVSTLIPETKPIETPDLEDDENVVKTDKEQEYNYGKGQILIKIPKVNNFEILKIHDEETIIESVLTEEEMKKVAEGETITIYFEVNIYENEEQVPKNYKRLIHEVVKKNSQKESNLMVGVYMNIKLYKITSSGEKNSVEYTDEPIEIVINLPEEIRFVGAKYYLISAYENQATLLEDFDYSDNTVTIKTKEFSTYAITYSLKEHNTCYLYWIIFIIITLIVTSYIVWKKKLLN